MRPLPKGAAALLSGPRRKDERCLKSLGLAAVAGAALFTFAGTASATTLTKGGGVTMGVGEAFEAVMNSAEANLKGAGVEMNCKESEIRGKITNAGGAASTVQGEITAILIANCTESEKKACMNNPVILARGTLEFHTAEAVNNGDGTLTSSGLEFTTECITGGFHCVWKTSGTDLGRILGGTPAEISTVSASIGRVGGRSGALCGNNLTWTARYRVSSPTTFLVD